MVQEKDYNLPVFYMESVDYLKEFRDRLNDEGNFIGSELDFPEGSRVMTISHTLAKELSDHIDIVILNVPRSI